MLGYIVFLLLALRASAFCPECVDTDYVRLSNSGDPCAGVVLVEIHNIEGTICDLYWDMNDAAVVCRQLGCGVPISAPGGSVFGAPRNTFPKITNVGCRGDESSVLQCSYSSQPQQSCRNKRDASVQCTGPDEVRLVNGANLCSGRVEIRHNGVWGTVCDNAWDQKDALVVCRQLRCRAVQGYQYSSSFGISPLPVLMSDVQCQGNESTLWKCAQRGWNVNTCPTGGNAGVTCTGGADTIRLVNSGDACSGRVEIKHENRWGTVCDSGWDEKDAQVVCRQLNCGSALRAETNNGPFENGVFPVWLSDVQCTGAERSIFDCPRAPWGFNKCPTRRDSGVKCRESRVFDPTVFKAPLSVDPKAADGTLLISSDGKEVQNLSFEEMRCVPRSTGVLSGKWYWVVTIGQLASAKNLVMPLVQWALGVASDSAKERIHIHYAPSKGIWALSEGWAGVSVTDETDREHYLDVALYNVGIFVDYEEGLVSFYDAKNRQHLYTYTATFQEEIYPYICIGERRRVSLK